jgi:hypothetical protein
VETAGWRIHYERKYPQKNSTVLYQDMTSVTPQPRKCVISVRKTAVDQIEKNIPQGLKPTLNLGALREL